MITQGKTRRALILLTALLFVFSPVKESLGAAAQLPRSVQISLPDFPIHINDRLIDNLDRRYPLIVYKDITYVPMTWLDCRFLGLETSAGSWNAGNGLAIRHTGVSGGYYKDSEPSLNRSRTYTAQLPLFPITINDRIVQNNQEPYPLLVFRDITYFPLTWRFAVEEFGWVYGFSDENGLTIHSGGAATDSMTVSLPLARRGDYPGACVVAEDWIYYEGPDGWIYSAPLSDPAQAKPVYQLPKWDYGSGESVYAGLGVFANGKPYLSYRQGGATMGYNYLARLNPNGVEEELTPNTMEFQDVSICVARTSTGEPMTDNLSVKIPDDASFRTIGDPELDHSPNDVSLFGNFVYTAASPDYGKTHEWPGHYYIYKTNIQTGESVKLLEETIWNAGSGVIFVDAGNNRIRFMNARRMLMETDLNGEGLRQVPDMDRPISQFAVTDSDIYYVDAETEALHRVSDGQALYPEAKVSGLRTDRDGYVWCTFYPEDEYYRIIFDPVGNQIYQGGHRDKVLIYQDTFVFVNIIVNII
jgi:hypothetical protein